MKLLKYPRHRALYLRLVAAINGLSAELGGVMTHADQTTAECAFELEVVRVIHETPDTRSFILAPSAACRAAFRYQAGQFLTFEIPFAGRTLRRCYSMSSSPENDVEMAVTVKRVPDGPISNWFIDEVRPGARLRVLPPAGRFTLTNLSVPILFLAGGSGITPIISLIKSALMRGNRQMTLFYANRSRSSTIFRDALEDLAAANAHRLTVVHHTDDEVGQLEPSRVAALARRAPNAEAFLCGPGPFMASIESILVEEGFTRDRIFIERFVSPSIEVNDAKQVVLGVSCSMLIRLGGVSQLVAARPDETVLQAARRAGIAASSACEQGICGTCVARVIFGRSNMLSNQLLTAEEVADGLTLTCQTVAVSDRLEVHYD